MNENLMYYKNPITFHISTLPENVQGISVELQYASDDTGPGLPGKEPGEILLYQNIGGQLRVLVSLGKEENINPEQFRRAGGGLVRWAKQVNAETIELDGAFFQNQKYDLSLQPFIEGILLGAYEFLRLKKSDPVTQIAVYITKVVNPAQIEKDLARINEIAMSVNLAREWSHEPANVINPQTLAERALKLAGEYGLKCTVLGESELKKIGAGGILAVGQGSQTKSRLIILEYPGINADEKSQPIVLVGKSITFDTGGYSLKSTENILGMKYDKCGGMTVLATLKAAASLKLSKPLIGVICAAENMVSAESYRPDDIITMLSGKTVEIISTDAEGRLVLADGLAYTQKYLNPKMMIDLATLTGGVVVSLGRVRAGIMANNDELANALISSGDKTHERLWRLPLDDDYAQQIKTDDADIKNSGGREAQPVIGGMFLKQFVEDSVPWAHIDIAGVAGAAKDMPYCTKGATGFGVRLLIDFLETIQ